MALLLLFIRSKKSYSISKRFYKVVERKFYIADISEEENYPKIAEEMDARILPPTNAAVHYREKPHHY